MLRCVRKEGKVFFAFGSKVKFRSQQSRLYTDKGDKIYYKCWGLVLKCYELKTRQHKNVKCYYPSSFEVLFP
jgi:hypothetical protein